MRHKNEDKITNILKKIAPGTPIRDGLENILKAMANQNSENRVIVRLDIENYKEKRIKNN